MLDVEALQEIAVFGLEGVVVEEEFSKMESEEVLEVGKLDDGVEVITTELEKLAIEDDFFLLLL